MIDRETAIEWAKDAGFSTKNPGNGEFVCAMHSTGRWVGLQSYIEALITRAQAEAFEQAAQACENKEVWNMDAPGETAAYTIRSLKFKEPKIQGEMK